MRPTRPELARRVLPLAVLAVASLMVGACGSSGDRPQDPTVAKGYDLYTANCSVCHGATGGGGTGPRLIGIGDRLSDAKITETVSQGRPGTAMPAWSQRGLSDDDIAAVVAYVKTFQGG